MSRDSNPRKREQGWLQRSLEEAAAEAEKLPKWARELDAAIERGSSSQGRTEQ